MILSAENFAWDSCVACHDNLRFWEITCFDPNFSSPTVLRMELLKEEAAGIIRVKLCESPMAAAHEERACEMPKNSSDSQI